MTHKNFLKSFLILTLGLATTVLTFNACGDEEPNPEDVNNPEQPNKPVETAGFKVGAYNVETGQFTDEPVNFNTAFTFAIEVKDAKFKAALDAAPTGAGGTARILAFFDASYSLQGSDVKTKLSAPANEERLTRVPNTFIFYKENYSTGTTLAEGTNGLIHFNVLVAEIGSAYWYDESDAAGTIAYAGGMTFAVPGGGTNPGGGGDGGQTSYNWFLSTETVQYAADGVTETYRAETTYDAQGRISGSRAYQSGVLTSQTRDYQYSGRTVTYITDSYMNGALYSSYKAKITYCDRNWIQVTQSIIYTDAAGTSEGSRTEITYDAEGRENSYKYYSGGFLTGQNRDYNFNGRTVTYVTDSYNNGNVIGSTKYKKTYCDKNYIQFKEQISYNSDGVTEYTRMEYTYDNNGKTTSYKYYINGALAMQQRDYSYSGNTATYYADIYANGSVYSTTKTKVTYYNK